MVQGSQPDGNHDEVFEEDEDISKTFQLMQDKMFRLGYRDGVIWGKEEAMQTGFDAGFAHASRLLVVTGMTSEEAARLASSLEKH